MKNRRGLFSLLHCLVKDEQASILLQAIVYIVAIFGMIGLALDGGRYLLLNNGLQALADSAAIAGAAELDFENDALTRATNAANAFAQSNNPRWADIAGAKIQSIIFYADSGSGGPGAQTTDPSQASYIGVTTGPWQVSPTFLAAVSAGAITTAATAVAGAVYASCAPVQTYLCGPNFPNNLQAGQMFSLISTPTTGNWGVMDVPGCGSNPHCYKDYFAQSNANACNIATVDQRPGFGASATGSIAAGINVRFDQPQGTSGDLSTTAQVLIDGSATTKAPGNNCKITVNTPPGFNPNNYTATCNLSTSSAVSCPLPRDRTLTSNIGNGPNLLDLQAYWKNQHPSTAFPNTITTRYGLYRCELGLDGCAAPTWNTTTGHEPGVWSAGSSCSATVLTGEQAAQRRKLSVAILATCPAGNSGPNLPYAKYADFFITESVVSGAPVYAEYIQTFTSGSLGSALRKVVKLYR
jgi:Flp pilus assembly protein TadG